MGKSSLLNALIGEHLGKVLEAEQIAAEPAAIRLVAQAADGSMRDALSLLDQLIAFGGGKVEEASARAMLGTIDRAHVVPLMRALAAADSARMLEISDGLEEFAPDYGQLLDEIAALLTRVALRQIVPDYEGDELFDPAVVAELASAIGSEDVQLYYQTAILGRRDLALAPDPRSGFQMTLVRMLAFRPSGGAVASAGATGTRAAGAVPASTGSAPVVRPSSAGPIDPVQWARVIGDLDVTGADQRA